MEKILNDVKNIVKKAGDAVMELYGKEYGIKDKKTEETAKELRTGEFTEDNSPVTEVDLLSEKIILAGLEKYDYGVLSEESADDKSRLNKERVWIIDPLDGTKDFIQKTGEFTIMVGLVEKGRPVLGVVYAPALGRMYYAVKGGGAYVAGKNHSHPLLISPSGRGRDRSHRQTPSNSPLEKGENQNGQTPPSLPCATAKALCDTRSERGGEIRIISSRNHRSKEELEFVEKNNAEIITCGSAGLKICKIAAGEADITFNPSDKTYEWDVCAADVILAEAGGSLRTFVDRKRFVYNKKEPRNLKGYWASICNL